MTVDRASLTFDALGLRALADAPARARLEDTGNTAAIEFAVGVGVLISEAGRLGDDVVRGHPKKKARSVYYEVSKRAQGTHLSKNHVFFRSSCIPLQWTPGAGQDSRRTDTQPDQSKRPEFVNVSSISASTRAVGTSKGFLFEDNHLPRVTAVLFECLPAPPRRSSPGPLPLMPYTYFVPAACEPLQVPVPLELDLRLALGQWQHTHARPTCRPSTIKSIS